MAIDRFPSFSDGLGMLEALGSELEADLGPRVVYASVSMPAREVSFGVATASDLRTALALLKITNTSLYGDVRRPQRAGTATRDGWTIVVYGPSEPAS